MAFRSSAKATSNVGGTITATPAGVLAHDYLCGLYVKDGSGATVNLPSGYTTQATLPLTLDSQQAWLADKPDASGADAFGFSDSVGSKENVLVVGAWSGRNNASPRTALQTTTVDSNNTPPVSASLTGATAVDGDDIAAWLFTDGLDSAPTITCSTITNYTEREDGVITAWVQGINLQTRDNVSAGATGSLATTISVSAGTAGMAYAGAVVAIARDPVHAATPIEFLGSFGRRRTRYSM